eukprot:366203-Chlamydomonas_euryale.AAC.1
MPLSHGPLPLPSPPTRSLRSRSKRNGRGRRVNARRTSSSDWPSPATRRIAVSAWSPTSGAERGMGAPPSGPASSCRSRRTLRQSSRRRPSTAPQGSRSAARKWRVAKAGSCRGDAADARPDSARRGSASERFRGARQGAHRGGAASYTYHMTGIPEVAPTEGLASPGKRVHQCWVPKP